MKIGIISDTHACLHPKIFEVFQDVDVILHAGDIGEDTILDDLEALAPVHAVSGNMDGMPTVRRPQIFCETYSGVRVCMAHGHQLDSSGYHDSARKLFEGENPQIVIFGHSHTAHNETVDGITYLNPGAACRPRFRDVSSIAVLDIEAPGKYDVTFYTLEFERLKED